MESEGKGIRRGNKAVWPYMHSCLIQTKKIKIKIKTKKKKERERQRLVLQNIKTSKTGNWREQFKQPTAAS